MQASVSIDLDEIPCYGAIHGLAVPEASATAIYDLALPRLLEMLEREGIRATLFVVGRDLERASVRAALARAHAQGHELASHSQSHYYDLTRRPLDTIRSEVRDATSAIASIANERPVGFRAPGYTITDDVLRVLVEEGYEYDSSVFPCPGYYGLKATAIGLIAARGRASRSIVDDPRVLAAPADPYRIGTPYWSRGRGLVELPIGVTRDATLRLPYIGTNVALSSERGARMWTRAIVGRPHVNLELHGIDAADADPDGLAWLRPHQVDLRKSADAKVASIRAAIGELREAGYAFATLRDVARGVR